MSTGISVSPMHWNAITYTQNIRLSL